jgi:DNA-binding XRE family transcriptional regulator
MRNAVKKDLQIVVVPFDPRKGRIAVERLARTAAKLRDSGEADHVALPVEGAAAMAEIMEDIEDAELYRARAGEPVIPHEVVEAIHKGVHPVRAWRKHKGLTLQELAKASGLPTGYLSEIETGKKPGSVAAYKALARALGTPIDMLIAK